jgi:CubicO group peptidase (beta-lactamase class C family)
MQTRLCQNPLIPALLVLILGPNLARSADPQIAGLLRPFVDKHVLAGAVTLVSTADKTVSLQAVGYADVDAKVVLKTDDLFWIASMSKPMTATALMMLVDEGKVKLDDPVKKYLPEYRGQMLLAEKDTNLVVLKRPRKPITVRNILSHTAGLVGRSPLEDKFDEVPLRIGVITYAMSPLQFEPGSKYEYNNPGINTAGRIIEVVSGLSYEDFMRTRLFEPLRMKDTTFWPDEDQSRRVARSYKPNTAKDGLQVIPVGQLTYPLSDRTKRHGFPAGGLFSTAEDIATFCRMILKGGTYEGKRYLSPVAVREMTSTQTGDLLSKGNGEGGYGLGWATTRRSKGEAGPVPAGECGHGGAYATNMTIDPDRGLITVFMVQHAGYPGTDGPKIFSTFVQAARETFGK